MLTFKTSLSKFKFNIVNELVPVNSLSNWHIMYNKPGSFKFRFLSRGQVECPMSRVKSRGLGYIKKSRVIIYKKLSVDIGPSRSTPNLPPSTLDKNLNSKSI
jgi:hypothetical protein